MSATAPPFLTLWQLL